MELDKLPLGKPGTAVASFVTLLADLCALDEVKMACYLDCYFQLRKHAEDAEELEPVVLKRNRITIDDIEGMRDAQEMRAKIIEEATKKAEEIAYHPYMEPETSKTYVVKPFPPLDEVYKGLAPTAETTAPDPAPDSASDPAPDPAPMPPKGFVPVRPNPLRGGASAKFKKETRERLEALRKTSDLSLQAIADASGGTLTLSDLLSILECQKVDLSLYLALSQTLDKLAN